MSGSRVILPLLAALALLSACQREVEQAPPEIRPVRTVTIEKRVGGSTVAIAGTVQAQNEVNQSFRIDGRLVERLVDVGDNVKAGQLIATLDPQNEESGVQAARAQLSAAQARLVEARSNYERMRDLVVEDAVSRAQFDQAEALRKTAESQVEAAQSQVALAQNRLGYTRLFSNVTGVVTARGPAPGEIVSPGRMVVQVARRCARRGLRRARGGEEQRAQASGHRRRAGQRPQRYRGRQVREVAPRADPVTGTFAVRVRLINPPAAMRLLHRHRAHDARRRAGDRDPSSRWCATTAGRRCGSSTPRPRRCRCARSASARRLHRRCRSAAAGRRRRGRHRWRAGAAPRTEGEPARGRQMIGPNLSEWSLKRPSFIIFLMILAVAAGVLAFRDLGRDEDPPFTVRTMIVAAAWPGATVEETLQQVTERLERTLQETHKFDAVRSYTIAGQTTIFVDLDETTDTADIPDVWYRVRRNIGDMRGTLPAGVLGPFFNDDFGDTFGIIYGFTADGFSFRELRDYAEDIRSKLLQVPDVAKIEVLGAQDERIYIEFSNEKLAGLRLNLQSIISTLQAQNLLRPSGVLQTDKERIYLRVSGAFDDERDIENVNIVMGERVIRLGDIAEVKRGFVDPPTPMFRVNGQPAIGLAISMRDQADILTLGKNIRTAMADIRASLPVGIEPHVVADQSTIVDVAINDFLTSLYQAIGIILLCSFVSLGVRPGIVVALAIPITLAIVFTVMNSMHIDLQRVSLGALIIALTLLVDDAMTTVDAMQRRLAAGDAPDAAASFAYRTLAAPMLIGTLVTIASFVPVGFAPGGASEVLSSLFSVVAVSLIASWLVAVVFGPIIGKALLKPPAPVQGEPSPAS